METKNSNPSKYLAGKTAHSIIALYFQVNHLKQLYRQGWLKEGRDISKEHCESVADHVFGLIILAIFMRDMFFPKVDLLKLVTMLAIHEFGETGRIGDVTPDDNISSEEKHRLERETVLAVLQDFPNGQYYIDLWEEFEKGETAEAKVAKSLDKLEMCMQAKIYSFQHEKDLQQFFDRARGQIQFSEILTLFEEVEKI